MKPLCCWHRRVHNPQSTTTSKINVAKSKSCIFYAGDCLWRSWDRFGLVCVSNVELWTRLYRATGTCLRLHLCITISVSLYLFMFGYRIYSFYFFLPTIHCVFVSLFFCFAFVLRVQSGWTLFRLLKACV